MQEVEYVGVYPVLETGRLILRMFEPKDLNTAYRLFNDPEVQKYLSPKNRRNLEQVAKLLKNSVGHWKKRGYGLWCVSEKINDEMIGYCGFQKFDKTENVEIVFGYIKESWGKGFATEAANSCFDFGFEKLSFKRIFAVTDPRNTASLRVLEKSGMTFLKKESHYEMKTVIYSIPEYNLQK